MFRDQKSRLNQKKGAKNVQGGQNNNKAAVLIAIARAKGGDESVLLTLRSSNLSSHSGEVSFPGGKWEVGDASLLDTALRETHEEVGLCPTRINIIEELPESATRRGVRVKPFVGRVDSPEGLVINNGELQSLFWVPMGFLLSDQRIRTDIFELMGREYWSPVYRWMDYTIWGFTARVIVDFLNRVYGQNIGREHSAPEVKQKPK